MPPGHFLSSPYPIRGRRGPARATRRSIQAGRQPISFGISTKKAQAWMGLDPWRYGAYLYDWEANRVEAIMRAYIGHPPGGVEDSQRDYNPKAGQRRLQPSENLT